MSLPVKPGPKDGPNAIGKLVAVVESLATESKVSRIARETGLATSTVHRILRSLVQAGWAHEDGDRGYVLGTRLLAITERAGFSGPPPGDDCLMRLAPLLPSCVPVMT